jgi:phospholipid N-methyltransferase
MIAFLKAALININQTGSIVESSVHLSEKMIGTINFEKNLQLVELGAGTGIITKRLLKKMNDHSTLTTFEINPYLFNKLQENSDERLIKINADASFINQYCREQSVDYIISGLPLANISAEKKTLILDACHQVLKPGGSYIQFQYSQNDFKLLRKIFKKVDSCFTLLNLPPAFIYYAQKAV